LVDISGKWDGVFAYPDVPDAGPVTPFVAEIVERDGRISGTILEPHEFRSGTAHASLEGVRAGRTVDFLKTYHAAGAEYEEPVAYAGSLSADGNIITGHWMMSDWSGPFEMVRQLEVTIASEAQAAVNFDA
jgi:hypothetical protein